jgi:uncharacterized protein (TIGR00730 family)
MAGLSSVCVYCGASVGSRPEYAAAARTFAAALVRRGLTLVYGGASIGIMGVLADAVLQAGGRVVGVIPRPLLERELGHPGLTELRVTETMHERKAVMAQLADAFVALPGGIGTLEELFEVWTWAQLGLHHKPCGLLNSARYYDALIEFLAHAAHEDFLRGVYHRMLLVAADADELLDRLAAYEPPTVQPWLRSSQS